jgi:hypothetical protein
MTYPGLMASALVGIFAIWFLAKILLIVALGILDGFESVD